MRRIVLFAAVVLAAISSLGAARAHATTRDMPRRLTDESVVAILEMANTFDLETGDLAAKRARRADVREFGKMLARDHKAVRQQGRDLAAKLHIEPADLEEGDLSIAHKAAMKKLNAASAADFDAIFLQHEVAYHEQMIKLTNESLLPAIKNAELKKFVTTIAPAFVAHRDAAANLLKK
jgi:putative membrane protein